MKLKTYLLGAAVLVAGTAMAEQFSANQFPSCLPPAKMAQQGANPLMRAPLNPDMNKGTKIFGTTMNDYSGMDHFGYMFSSNPSQLTKMTPIPFPGDSFDEDYYRRLGFLAGGYIDGKYYTWRVRYYDMNITLFDDWVEIDPATGEMTELAEYYDHKVQPESWPQNIFTDPRDESTAYVLANNTDGTVTAAIWEIDPANGEFVDKIVSLKEYYFSAAYDFDGNLYGLRWDYDPNDPELMITGTVLDVMDPDLDYDVVSSTPLLVDGKKFLVASTANNIAFDYTTGDLYWTATDREAKFYLIRIDPKTMTAKSLGRIGIEEWFGGLYIPYQVADNRKAPAQVEDLKFTIDPAGNNKVTLSWTNPTTQWNRSALSSLTEVLIFRDKYEGEPVATIDASGQVGKPMTWTDDKASEGIHTYYVTACAKKGEKGVPRSIDAYVGKDVPGPVQNLTAATTDVRTINITWEKPAIGDNDGWYDETSLSYSILRLPDNKDLGTVTEPTYTDSSLEQISGYSYRITAKNAKGTGATVESNQVLAGKSIVPPFYTDFSTKVDVDRFITLDNNADGFTFAYDFCVVMARYAYKMNISNGSNDDVAVSPVMNLQKGKTYKLTYDLAFGGYGSSHRVAKHAFKIIGGTQPTKEGLTNVIADESEYEATSTNFTDKYVTYFESPVDGDYHIGFNLLTSGEAETWGSIYGFSIEPVADHDLQAVSVKSHLILSTEQENRFSVNLYNNASADESAYKVKLAYLGEDGKPVVFAETADVPALASHKNATVELYSKFPKAGSYKLVALVELEGDGYADNDMTEPLRITADDADAFTRSVDQEKHYISTNIPLNHTANYTACQTIYNLNLTSFDEIFKGYKPAITRMAWEYEGRATFEGTSIGVYLTQDDQRYFDFDYDDWIAVTAKPVFTGDFPIFEGNHYMLADLDEPFVLDINRPLVVTITKFEQGHSDFLTVFNTIDGDWHTETYHSRLAEGASAIDLENPVGTKVHPDAPVLHLAFDPKTVDGIENVAITGDGAIFFNSRTNTLQSARLTLTSVDVYDLSGRLVTKVTPLGGKAAINVAKGIYMLRANTLEGKTISIKANVR